MRVVILLVLIIAGCTAAPRGTLLRTNRPYDFAIDGEGYFIVETGHGGYLFTRRGDFFIDTNRYVVTADGYRLAPPLQIPQDAGEMRVALDGRVVSITSAGRGAEPVGRIRVATFAKPDALDRDGTYFIPTAGSGDPVTREPGSGGAGTIKTGFLEK
ncbi:MAG: flagellar hook basal-body protein [Burkholderiales bacterium]|nr:flagellar hook basal-body protein [Phycisphaerae bacterium]